MRHSWLGASVIAIVVGAFIVAPFVPMIVFGIAIHSAERPETGPEPSDRQLIAVAKQHRAALDDLVRMRREHRISSIDLQTSTYSPYCETDCPDSPSIRFDSTLEPWKRYVRDLHDLHALSVQSGYELMVIVWEGGGWRDLPEKGYSWTDRSKHECVVSDLSYGKFQTCSVAYLPLGRSWYAFRD